MVGGKNIAEVTALRSSLQFLSRLKLNKHQMMIEQILKEINARIHPDGCGQHYLTLSRATGSLSGGEAQRIRLATQIGPALVGGHIFWMSQASACTRGIMTNC